MESRFWNRDGSSSGSDSDDDSDSDVQSNSGSEDKARVKKPAVSAAAARWMAMDDSSSDEDEKRVVRSAKDKRWDQLRQLIRAMQNHKNIDDFVEIQAGLDGLLRAIQKAKTIVEKEGIPPFFVRALAELEKYVGEKFADKEGLKKLSKAKSTSFNTLRSKVRKNLEEYRPYIEAFNANPAAFADAGDELDDESNSALSDDDDEDSDDLSGDSDEDSSEFSDDDDDSSSSSSSGGSSSDEDSDGEGSGHGREWHASGGRDADGWSESECGDEVFETGDDEAHKRVLQIWGKDTAVKKSKTKKSKTRRPAQPKAPKIIGEPAITQPQHGKVKLTSIFLPGEKVTAELVVKKLKEVTSLRGRKGFDRYEQIRHLNELSEAAKAIGPQTRLDTLGHLISAYFDANLGAFVAIAANQWSQCYEALSNALDILRQEKDCYFPFLVSEDEDAPVSESGEEVAPNTAAAGTITPPQKTAGTEPVTNSSREAKARLDTAHTLTRFLERLDDELTKALQLTDFRSSEYKLRLGHTVDMLVLLWKSYMHFTQNSLDECASSVSLRILEHVYHKKDAIAARVWELVKTRLDAADCELLSRENFTPSDIVAHLVNYNLQGSRAQSTDVRLILYLAYSRSLHGHFYEARDLLQTANVQELAAHCNISTQIFFNRNLVQLGLAAFRLGLIQEAHSYLSEVCAMGRYKELLAQGLSNTRGLEKTQEQESIERRRLLPYHMHISSDLVEAVHNICAMLLEVPYMAANPFDMTKKPIARNFRRLLEIYDRQVVAGPPENPREYILAATKALQKGNWKVCAEHIMALKIWDSLSDAENVKAILTERIKQEALRTHLLSYASLYDSVSVKQLSDMFALESSTVHSIVSKMVIQGFLSGSWDGASECILINRVERSSLQLLALRLTEKIALSVDQNETVLAYKNPKFVLSQPNQRDDRGRRYDDRWNNTGDRRAYGDFNRGNHNDYRQGQGRQSGLGMGSRNVGGGISVGGGPQRRRW